MTIEEKEIFALQAYPPDLEGNGMTWPFVDRNEPYRNKLISALESMEANGMEISIKGKIKRNNTLSKKILKEAQSQGLDEAAKRKLRKVCNLREDLKADKPLEERLEELRKIRAEKDRLDEAAEEYEKWVLEESYEDVCVEEDGHVVPCITISHKDAFKAGAKWQAEQGEETEEAEVGYWNQTGLSIRMDKALERLGYEEGDKVRLQITKI